MFQSIIDDIKLQLNSGNTLTRIILINIAVYVFVNILFVFTSFGAASGIYAQIIKVLAIPSAFPDVLIYAWTWVTHMFLHEGFWHLLWNMVLLYWFGRIVGDFLGDDRVLPIYLLGGLTGALFYVLSANFIPGGGSAMALGASAAVMAMMMTAASISPNYVFHLLLLGPVKIKYIAIVILFLDVIGTASNVNTGGHWGHLGGAFFGWIYVNRLHAGMDLTGWLQALIQRFGSNNQVPIFQQKRKRVPMEVVYNRNASNIQIESEPSIDFQEKLDDILDKINEKGIDHLTSEEKEFLENASKK